MEENQNPPTPPTTPEKPEEKSNVIDFFSRKKKNQPPGISSQSTSPQTEDPNAPSSKVIQLTPKEQADFERLMAQARGMWLRRAGCMFDRSHRPEGCTCNYCVYINSMSLRVFDLIQSDISYQMRRGKMLFCTSDMLDILQIAIERVVNFEESQKKGPPSK